MAAENRVWAKQFCAAVIAVILSAVCFAGCARKPYYIPPIKQSITDAYTGSGHASP